MIALVKIPAGDFLMGAAREWLNDTPQHRVEVPPFELGKTAVTVAEYSRYLAASGAPRPDAWNEPGFDDPKIPATSISWLDAVAYCGWLSQESGREFFLPTEAMREWAARGGREHEYPWGDEPLALQGPLVRPDRCGEDSPNGFGLHDMGTGVHEWCADWYGATYYAVSPRVDPRGPEAGSRRVARGGSWRHALPFSRCSARSALDPAKRFSDFGFRVAAR